MHTEHKNLIVADYFYVVFNPRRKMIPTKMVFPSSSFNASSIMMQSLLYSRVSFSTSTQARNASNFVPKYEDANDDDLKALSEFVNSSKNLLAITGN